MLGIALLVILALWLAFLYPIIQRRPAEVPKSDRYNLQMKKLWNAAQTSMREHKPLRAEKALLTILKFDEKNAAAYNRLGILYAKEQKFDEAIECFEIAQSLDNNPSSLHNVGLIYLETGAYEKAAMAFEQAISLENTLPARYIALAKAREKLGQIKAAVDALEQAYDLDHSLSTLRQILALHEAVGDSAGVADTTARIEAQLAEAALEKAAASRRSRAGRLTARASKSTTKPTTSAAKSTRPTAVRTTIKPARAVATSTAKISRLAPSSTGATIKLPRTSQTGTTVKLPRTASTFKTTPRQININKS